MTALVMDVGCLECGLTTTVFGVYPTVTEAKQAVTQREDWHDANGINDHWFPTQGQSVYVIVDLDQMPPTVVAAATWRYMERQT